MPKIIGDKVRVVEHDGLTIDEYAGNVASKANTLSVATVEVSQPTSEPWMTLGYDEWLCVTAGSIDLHYISSEETKEESVLVVKAGQTAFISKGEYFRPVFTEPNTSYIPVCLPAFSPDLCIRDEEGSDVADKLKELHSNSHTDVEESKPEEPATVIDKKDYSDYEVLYHMCQKSLWDEAVAEGRAYFAPTFEQDGMFTHATAVPERLISTANHFYTATKGDWICLQLSRKALFKLGIDTIFEEAKPVGSTDTSETFETWVCPHIYGGLPTHIDGIVTKIFDMKREEDGSFTSIIGLTD